MVYYTPLHQLKNIKNVHFKAQGLFMENRELIRPIISTIVASIFIPLTLWGLWNLIDYTGSIFPDSFMLINYFITGIVLIFGLAIVFGMVQNIFSTWKIYFSLKHQFKE